MLLNLLTNFYSVTFSWNKTACEDIFADIFCFSIQVIRCYFIIYLIRYVSLYLIEITLLPYLNVISTDLSPRIDSHLLYP